MIAASGPASKSIYRSRALFYGAVPKNYEVLNRDLLVLAPPPEPAPSPGDRSAWLLGATVAGLEQTVKVLPLPSPVPKEVSALAIAGMEHLRDRGVLTALRGGRPTDLPRPLGGRIAAVVHEQAPGLVRLLEHVEEVLAGSPLFVRAVKLDAPRASTTAPGPNPGSSNLHFDAEKSSLAEYSDPVWQFYLNAGQLERQFRILPVLRDDLLSDLTAAEQTTLPLETALARFLASSSGPLETLPVESGALAIFDGRRFAHDAGKSETRALAAGRFEPTTEPDLVLALDTAETGYHQGHYRPELPFLEDRGVS